VARVSSPAQPLVASQWDVRTPAAQLSLAGVAIAGLFAIFLVVSPVWTGQPPRARLSEPDLAPAGWGGIVLALVLISAACLPFRPYHLAQRAADATLATPLLVMLTALIGLVAVLIYPSFGGDIFDYAGFERMWVAYGDNPLRALPIDHAQDWLTPYVWYPDRTPAYGPLWALLTWPLVRLAGDSASAIVAGYKILSTCAYAACCWLIWTSVSSARRKRALVAFAWSPLVLFEALGKVHNDILLALSVLGAVWLLQRRSRGTLSLTSAVAGALVKVTALVVAPPLIAYVWRRAGWRAALISLGIAAVLVAALYVPFWAGPQTLAPVWNQTSRVVWSPASLLIVASAWLPGGPYASAVHVLFGLLWVSVCALLVLRSPLVRPADLAATCGWVLLVSVLLLTSAVYAHYLVPAVALAAISEDERLQRLIFWLSVGAQAAYAVDLLGLTLGPAWLGSDQYRVVGTLVMLGPALLMFLLARRAVTLTSPP
jgi:hypothetical protein